MAGTVLARRRMILGQCRGVLRRRGKKRKGMGKWSKGGGKHDSKDGSAHVAEAAPTSSTAVASTFFMNHFSSFTHQSFLAGEADEKAYLSQPLSPTSLVLDLGCTRAMASRTASQNLMDFFDKSGCGIWYRVAETLLSFANSESAKILKCTQKLVVCMYDKEYAVQSTEFDSVEQGHVPLLVSLPQMRNLKFQFELSPGRWRC